MPAKEIDLDLLDSGEREMGGAGGQHFGELSTCLALYANNLNNESMRYIFNMFYE